MHNNDTDETIPDTPYIPPRNPEDEQILADLMAALRDRRKERHLTQPDIAKMLSTRPNRVAAMENGDNEQLRITSAQRYARAVGARIRFVIEPLEPDTDTP